MSHGTGSLLSKKMINGWPLFWVISGPMSLVMIVEMLGVDLTTGPGVSEMIGFSVRWAVPFIALVVAISALRTLFPGTFTTWLMRNRKYIGLCFAVAMAWQGLFIFMMSNLHRGYYYEEIYYLRDELEGSTGYLFLAAMVVTSFAFGRRLLKPGQWRLLHLSGIYFLWAYPFSVYWWNLSYYPNPQPIDYVFYWALYTGFALRILAWGKKRMQSSEQIETAAVVPRALRALGALTILFGLSLSAAGLYWQDPITTFLTTPAWSANLELWLPFWPFEPFLSLFVLGLGTMLYTQPRRPAPAFA